jgi:hypothetical protein
MGSMVVVVAHTPNCEQSGGEFPMQKPSLLVQLARLLSTLLKQLQHQLRVPTPVHASTVELHVWALLSATNSANTAHTDTGIYSSE